MVADKGEELPGTVGDAEEVVPSRRNEVLRLRKTGLTYAKIGRVLGISKQAAHQIVQVKPSPPKAGLESKIMLRVGDVAQLLGLHPNTVRRWSDRGVLKPFHITERGDRRYRRQDIDDFLGMALSDKRSTPPREYRTSSTDEVQNE